MLISSLSNKDVKLIDYISTSKIRHELDNTDGVYLSVEPYIYQFIVVSDFIEFHLRANTFKEFYNLLKLAFSEPRHFKIKVLTEGYIVKIRVSEYKIVLNGETFIHRKYSQDYILSVRIDIGVNDKIRISFSKNRSIC
jgi:hypothetical protein